MRVGYALVGLPYEAREARNRHRAAEGLKNVALAAEIADGWLPFLFSPRANAEFAGYLAEGFARRDSVLRPREESVVTTMLVQGPAFALRTIRDVVTGTGSLARARLAARLFARSVHP